MHKKLVLFGFVFLWITALLISSASAASATSQYQHLSSVESEIVSRINGTNIYNYDLELEKIALDHNQSLYSFRSSGSVGANETAAWIQEQFVGFGLETHAEQFEFTIWNLLAQPILVIGGDGSPNATDNQVMIRSFQCEHYSWPTPDAGVSANVVTLPLPLANSQQDVGNQRYDAAAWNAVNTTGRVLLIGGEVKWNNNWYLAFRNKLEDQPPAAVIFGWSYAWMASAPPEFSSAGGRPASIYGAFFWDLHIPVGWVSYADGQLIRGRMVAENISAFVSIRAVIGQGPHYNIVAKLPGSVNPEKMIIISGHYDSTMDAAFCDNGAGTSAVIELARVFSEAAREGIYKPQYTLLFIAFAGEELGLAGSVNYVKQHASELGNIVAVINLDSLGSETMEISKSFPDDSDPDLQSVVMSAANDLNVTVSLTYPGTRTSDQEPFRDPADADNVYLLFWETRAGISNNARVKSSIIIDSYPLTWIHTENDNSTSTATLGWVTVERLENQTRVAGLSVIRVLSTIFSPFLLEVYGSLAAVGVVVVVVAYFKRSRVRALYQSFAHAVRSYIGAKEVLYIIVLTGVLLFASFALHTRVGEIEVINQGYPTIVAIEYFGTPLEMFGIVNSQNARSEGSPQMVANQARGLNVLWGGVLGNIAIFLLAAFVITFLVMKVKYTRELSKS